MKRSKLKGEYRSGQEREQGTSMHAPGHIVLIESNFFFKKNIESY